MRSTALAGIALLAISTVPAEAATVAFTNVSGYWYDAVGGKNVTGLNTASVNWGIPNPPGGQKSGYTFTGSGFSTTLTPPGSSGDVVIGTFQHLNFPIDSGSSITSIKLAFTADVLIDGNPYGTKTFNYTFSHWETTNNLNPCDNTLPNNTGLNINGCADQVKMNFESVSDTFKIGDEVYTLNLAGFLIGGKPANEFWTMENGTSTAEIRGRIDLYSVATAVPEPATWAMMILGFGGAGVAIRRQRRFQAVQAA